MINKFYKYIFCFSAIILIAGCSGTQVPERKKGFSARNLLKYDVVDTTYTRFKARSHVVNGSTFQLQAKHADAILEFQEALKYDTSAAIYFAEAKSFKELKKYDNAKEFLSKAIALDSAFIPAYDLMTEICLMAYDIKKAIYFFEIGNRYDFSVERKLSLAGLYEFDDQNNSIKLYEQALLERPDPFIYKKLAELYKKNNRQDDYANAIKKIFESDPSNIENVQEITDIYLANREYSKALDLASDLLGQFRGEELVGLFQNIGSYLADNSYTGPDSNIVRYINLIDNNFNDDPKVTYISGLMCLRTNNLDKSGYFFNQTLKYLDTIPDIPLQIAMAYERYEQYDSAYALLIKYEKSSKNDWRYSYHKAFCLSNLKQYGKAKEELEKAMANNVANFELIAYSAYISEKIDDYKSAIKLFEYGLGLDPYNPTLNNNYAFSLAERDLEFDKALKMARIALQEEPSNPSFLDTYGFIMYKLGNYDEALKYILNSFENGASGFESWERLGDVYVKMGNNSKALESYNKAVELGGDKKKLSGKIENIKK